MFKWEKYGRSTSSQKELRLTFKKRMFSGPQTIPENQVEFDLVFNQVRHFETLVISFSQPRHNYRTARPQRSQQALDDVRGDRYPLMPEEASFLVALRAQVELGNHEPAHLTANYPQLLDKYLPKHLRTLVPPEDIAAHHAKLKDFKKPVSCCTNWILLCVKFVGVDLDVLCDERSLWFDPRILMSRSATCD